MKCCGPGGGIPGGNKVQEAAAKIEEVGRGHWHFIGHLQTNKAKLGALLFDSVDSVDSLALGQELSKRAVQAERRLRILIEVNLGEASKFGVDPAKAEALAVALSRLPQLQLAGLMTVPPFFKDPQKTRPYFARLKTLRDQIETSTGLHLPVLSTGMSHDFEIAVEEGATERSAWVRPCSASARCDQAPSGGFVTTERVRGREATPAPRTSWGRARTVPRSRRCRPAPRVAWWGGRAA